MCMKKIAIIEDDIDVNNRFCEWIKEAKPEYQIDQYLNLESAENGVNKNDYDLIVLDIKLSHDNNAGIGLINTVNVNKPCPVLVVSGLTPGIYRPIMRKLNAWDYLEKPVEKEFFLTLVMDAIKVGSADHKQPRNKQNDCKLPDPDLQIDPLRQVQASWKGRRLNLSMTDQRIVHYIVTNADKLVTFKELFQQVPFGRNQTNIRSHIHVIRDAFRDVDEDFDRLHNVPMAGYIWHIQTG